MTLPQPECALAPTLPRRLPPLQPRRLLRPAGPDAWRAALVLASSAPPSCLPAGEVAAPLPCASFRQGRTGRWRLGTCRADGSAPHRAPTAHPTFAFRKPAPLARQSPAFPSCDAWQQSLAPSWRSAAPRRRASCRRPPSVGSSLLCEPGPGTWPETHPPHRGDREGYAGTRPTPSRRAVEPVS